MGCSLPGPCLQNKSPVTWMIDNQTLSHRGMVHLIVGGRVGLQTSHGLLQAEKTNSGVGSKCRDQGNENHPMGGEHCQALGIRVTFLRKSSLMKLAVNIVRWLEACPEGLRHFARAPKRGCGTATDPKRCMIPRWESFEVISRHEDSLYVICRGSGAVKGRDDVWDEIS